MVDDSLFASFRDWHSATTINGANGNITTITGTDASDFPNTDCTLFYSEGWHGLYAQGGSFEIDNTIVYGVNPVTAGHSRGISGGGGADLNNITDSIIASNYYAFLDSVVNTMQLTNCTVHLDNTNPSTTPTIFELSILGGNTGTINADGCIFSSATTANPASPDDRTGLLQDAVPAGGLNITDSAIVTQGPNRLLDGTGGTLTNVTFADPAYIQATDPLASDYMDVDNAQFAGRGIGSGNLAGGASYIGLGIPVELSIFSTN
jgi:hypothetical protein